MDDHYRQYLIDMGAWFQRIECRVPPPQKVPYLDHFVFRYFEKTLEQAVILKLARVVTGLHSARILLNNGFLQEQAALHRMLDEYQQDISFLVIARLDNELTDLHIRYLEAFFEEELDNPDSPVESTQSRPMIPRRKIRAYLARKHAEIGAGDQSRGAALMRSLSKAYSGFVHAASTQILNMYGGYPPRFHIHGMRGTPHEVDHRKDLWNYFYRGALAFHETTLMFGDFPLSNLIVEYYKEMQKHAGKAYGSHD